ncbi:MAG: hypothetical protein SOY97_12645 [Candidatus Metalachnospira sp.]|nr:hypothetical protein [Candidatus Metalachnospira sp.]
MDYTILLSENDKSLITTKYVPIFQNEQNKDSFKFIIPTYFSNMSPVLQVVLPDSTGKVKSCEYEPELYKNRYTFSVLIPSALTHFAGKLKLWLTFFGKTSDEILKTDYLYVDVLEHEGFNGSGGDGDFIDVATKISELEIAVKDLKETKADNIIVDSEHNTLSLISGSDIISVINLPNEVAWSGWSD